MTLKELVLLFFELGIQGTVSTVYQWLRMNIDIDFDAVRKTYPHINIINHISTFKAFLEHKQVLESLQEEDLFKIIQELQENNLLIYHEMLDEYSIKKINNKFCYNDELVFFLNTKKQINITQYGRSINTHFCNLFSIHANSINDINIALTEALENVIKFADHSAVIVQLGYKHPYYKLNIINSVKETLQINKKLYKDSLSQGIIIMKKIFDEFHFYSNQNLQYFEVNAKKVFKVQCK